MDGQLIRIRSLTSSYLSDGTLVTLSSSTLTFGQVQGNHTVSAYFIPTTFTLTSLVSQNGTIAPSVAQTIRLGGGQQFTASASPGYALNTWTVDSTEVSSATVLSDGTQVFVSGSTMTIVNVQGTHEVSVTFRNLAPYTVTVAGGLNGMLFPSGELLITVCWQPNISGNTGGYILSQWTVDSRMSPELLHSAMARMFTSQGRR